jgi:hypothetical protein
MKNKLGERELETFATLRRGGIPLDEEVLKVLKAASGGLSLFQTGTAVENTVFDLDSGGAGGILSIAVQNDSEEINWIRECRLEVLWEEPHFRWLDDPAREPSGTHCYSFPPPGPVGFEPEVVLNHRIGRRGQLYPGEQLEGLLLGVGYAPIPDQYRHRQLLRTQLVIVDRRGNHSALRIKLQVNREGHTRGKLSASAGKT